MPGVEPAEEQETMTPAEAPADAVPEAAEAASGTDEAVAPSETEADAGGEEDETAADGAPAAADEADDFTPHASAGHTRLVTDQGLTADKYAVSKPWIESDRLSEEEEAEIDGIEIEYDMRREEIVPGMKAFQRKVAFKKNMIYTAILAVIAILYGQAVWTDPSYDMGKVFIGLSIFVIFMLWFMPYRHIQNTVKAIEAEPESYRLTVTPVGILIPDNGGSYLIRYASPEFSAVELANAFALCVSREKVFIVPKRCVLPEKFSEVRQMLKDGLKERYQEKK